MKDTTPTPVPIDHPIRTTIRADRETWRQQLRCRRVAALAALLETRDDLRGVSAVADQLDDAVRWSA